MKAQVQKSKRLARRKFSVRKKVKGTNERPRVSVARSLQHISCQLIDDEAGITIFGLSTQSVSFKEAYKGGGAGNISASKLLGELIAKGAVEKGLTSVVFDRNGLRYHGRIKALADSMREHGLKL
ncbi:MAG: 50S ribosomal protein L18 [Planctomycetota bacterium]|nr:50S ribosomal protein L18 [Planctomycetota bacterium]MDA1141327.1 50S ribosomal protein L18 [Planctomycetota bacterium]